MREPLMQVIRRRLVYLVESEQMDERFLVEAVRNYLDTWADGHADTGQHDRRAADFRAVLDEAIDNSGARDGFRRQLAERDPAVAHLTDDEMIARLIQARDQSVFTAETSAEDASQRWALVTEWRSTRDLLMSDEDFKRWGTLRLLNSNLD